MRLLTSRGVVFARPVLEAPLVVVSALGLPEWRPGDLLSDQHVLRASRPLAVR